MKDILNITETKFNELSKEEQDKLIESALNAYEKGELSEDEFNHIIWLDYNAKNPGVDRTYP
ncbi:MAG: hypothetical protein ACRDDZ_01310 [Marinifilaceae bacterium]